MQAIHYAVSLEHPETHHLHVEVKLPPLPAPTRVSLPCWTPGSYLMREFARHIEHLEARTPEGAPLSARKVSKETWQIEHESMAPVVIRYRINAQELGVRTPYLDDQLGFGLGTNLCVLVEGEQGRPVEVCFSLPEGWSAFHSRADGFRGARLAYGDYDQLADAAFAFGPFAVHHFERAGRAHGFVVLGECRVDLPRVIEETGRIIDATVPLFEDAAPPYERYLFILIPSEELRGGLEHLDSVALIYPRLAFRGEASHRDFMTLISHEYFHVWNVKRIHSDALARPFDYTREAYSRELWVAEGWTSYYQHVLLRRAGLLTTEALLEAIGRKIAAYESQPGRLVQSLEDSSFDAWIKLYRRDANSPNATISYYLKGALAACLLDLEIRHRTDGARSLDDVLRHLWALYGRQRAGYPDGQLQALIEASVGGDYTAWFDEHIRSAAPLDWGPLERVGLVIERHAAADAPPDLGVVFEAGSLRIATAYRGGAAERARLMAGDEVLAIDRLRVTPATVTTLLQTLAVGDEVEVAFFRQGVLRQTRLTLGAPAVETVTLRVAEDATDAQRATLAAWLG